MASSCRVFQSVSSFRIKSMEFSTTMSWKSRGTVVRFVMGKSVSRPPSESRLGCRPWHLSCQSCCSDSAWDLPGIRVLLVILYVELGTIASDALNRIVKSSLSRRAFSSLISFAETKMDQRLSAREQLTKSIGFCPKGVNNFTEMHWKWTNPYLRILKRRNRLAVRGARVLQTEAVPYGHRGHCPVSSE